jgi:hypothetical protein
VVPDEEATHGEALGHHQHEIVGSRRRGRGVVGGDHAAQRDAPERLHGADRRLEVLAAHVVELDVDAVGGRLPQGLVGRRFLIVEGGVEAQLVPQEADLLPGADAADRLAARDPRQLPDHAADGARRAPRPAVARDARASPLPLAAWPQSLVLSLNNPPPDP